MTLSLEIDREAGAAYLRTLAAKQVDITKGAMCNLDFNEAGQLVGIELLELSNAVMDALEEAK